MTGNYLLEQRILNSHPQLPITEERYNGLAKARAVLSDALAFEQRYELLLGNFISMELAFTELCLRATLEPCFQYEKIGENLRQANRHVVNVLTAVKGYADQVPQDFRRVEGETPFKEIATAELNDLYCRSPDYRLLCQLRNHVQHRATAVHGFEETDSRANATNGWVEKLKFYTSKSTLMADKKFKKMILENQPEKIDVRRCLRRGIQELGATHLTLRKAAEEHIAAARSAFDLAIRDYLTAGAESAVGLCAWLDGVAGTEVPILMDWDDTRLKLVEKNARPARLWPTPTHREPLAKQIIELRQGVGQTQAQAAKLIFVPEALWMDYEDGLPMPEGLFHLYQLQVARHPTHSLTFSDSTEGPKPATR